MNASGAGLSVEAVLALFIVASAILAMPRVSKTDYSALQAMQLEHDLLTVWQNTQPSLEEMARDANQVFPNQSVRIQKNDKTIQWGARETPWVSSDGKYFDGGLQEQRVRVTLLN